MADQPEPGPESEAGPGAEPEPVLPEIVPLLPPPPPPVLETFYQPIYVVSAVFGAIFIIGPCLVQTCANKGIIRCCIMMTAFCMWIFWVTVYVSQMNPLIGPKLHNHTVAWVAHKWGDQLIVPPEEPIVPPPPEDTVVVPPDETIPEPEP